jgi:hypothetical protein
MLALDPQGERSQLYSKIMTASCTSRVVRLSHLLLTMVIVITSLEGSAAVVRGQHDNACGMQRIVLHSSPLVRFPTLFRHYQPTNTHSTISQSAQYRAHCSDYSLAATVPLRSNPTLFLIAILPCRSTYRRISANCTGSTSLDRTHLSSYKAARILRLPIDLPVILTTVCSSRFIPDPPVPRRISCGQEPSRGHSWADRQRLEHR